MTEETLPARGIFCRYNISICEAGPWLMNYTSLTLPHGH